MSALYFFAPEHPQRGGCNSFDGSTEGSALIGNDSESSRLRVNPTLGSRYQARPVEYLHTPPPKIEKVRANGPFEANSAFFETLDQSFQTYAWSQSKCGSTRAEIGRNQPGSVP